MAHENTFFGETMPRMLEIAKRREQILLGMKQALDAVALSEVEKRYVYGKLEEAFDKAYQSERMLKASTAHEELMNQVQLHTAAVMALMFELAQAHTCVIKAHAEIIALKDRLPPD